MAQRYGLVAFTSQCGYIIDTRSKPPTIRGTTPWKETHYTLKAKLAHPVKHAVAQAARTFSMHHHEEQHTNGTQNKSPRQ